MLRIVVSRKTVFKRTRWQKKRLCKIHGKPIRPSRWRTGHRTTGCADCYRTKKMPPRRKGCARNTSFRLFGSVGGPGTERKVALCALRFQNLKIGCVANMTDRFSPVRGSEAVTRRDAVSVSTVDLAMPPPKRVVGHGQNCGLSEPSAGNVSDGIGTSQSERESNFL
jgi:hypothetical protein